MNKLTRKSLTIGILLGTSALASPVFAQDAGDIIPPPRQSVDVNGVDLSTGRMAISQQAISIGTASEGLSFRRRLGSPGANWGNSFKYAAYGTPGAFIQIVAGDHTINFTYNSTTGLYTNGQGTGETLTAVGSNLTFTLSDGTIVQMDASDFDINADSYRYGAKGTIAVAHTIIFPNKEKWTITYKEVDTTGLTYSWVRPQSVLSSNGYMAKFEYMDNGTTYTTNWGKISKVTLLNTATDYCNPSADSCSFSKTWPSLTFTHVTGAQPTVDTVTDALNRTTTYTFGYLGTGNNQLIGIRRPTSSTDNTVISYNTSGYVTSIAIDGRTWTYAFTLASPTMTATVTNPDGTHKTYTTDTNIQQIKTEQDELGHTTTYTYDTSGRLTDITYPEGNKAHWDYDSRGNVLDKHLISKTAGTPPDIVASNVYPSSCTNTVTCNKPTSTTDANGNVTTYTYDPTHGGILTATLPAPTTGAVQPQTRYGYTALQAYYRNSSGAIVASGQSTYLLTSTSQCQTTASCAGAADEVKSTIGYGPQTAGVANNLLPVTVSSGSGNGTLTLTNTVTYDDVGNTTYVDGPLAGNADTTRTIYDAGRQIVGKIGPDPDGAGSLPNRAIRYTYNLDGQVTKLETGTTAGQSDTNWSAFSPLQVADITYDASGRELTRKLSAGGTAYALTQTSYDGDGRPQCTAVRMNTAVYGSLPSGACTLGTQGSYGPDRITKTVYDNAGEVTQIQQGVGTADASTERTAAYNPNGTIASLTDANNNVTSYTYDGFDRPIKTTYPGGSNEQVTLYDANGNAKTLLNRAGQTISLVYDALNRLTSKSGAVPTVNYSYDNLNRMLTSTFSTGGQGITNTFDALSRLTSTASNMGGTSRTLSYQYDLAGRRTRVTWPDGFYANYAYLTTDETSSVSDSTGATLATYAYDALGNRTSLSRGNGTVTSYGFDSVARLTSLTHDVAGTGYDITKTFAYNPASGLASETRSNDAYAWNGAVNVTRGYTSNGLNQYTAAGPASFTCDANGNLTGDGTWVYGYDAENHMTSASNAGTGVNGVLNYDPLGRLYFIGGNNIGDLSFVSDGDEMVADYDSTGALHDRFVFGPGVDEPIVQYDGSGSRTWLHADERGTIVARTDASGNATPNTYDEYGIPGSTNSGRFQYTGQMYLYEIGLDYYKARMYSPTLGRFMQTDPIGYGDGMNWYAYTHNDPVNHVDPEGKRSLTLGERNMLSNVFGPGFLGYLDHEVSDPDYGIISANPFNDSSFIMPHRVWFDSQYYRTDYSDYAPDSTFLKDFYHEFYHQFERYLGISSWGELFYNVASGGHSDKLYEYDPSKPFFQNNAEARAEYFANCVTKQNDCSGLNGVKFELDPTMYIKVTAHGFYLVFTATGSRIPHTVALNLVHPH